MHEDLEKNFQLNVVIPEIARQKAILDEQKEQYRKNYEIQRQRNAYSQAMAKANVIRRVGSNRSGLEQDPMNQPGLLNPINSQSTIDLTNAKVAVRTPGIRANSVL